MPFNFNWIYGIKEKLTRGTAICLVIFSVGCVGGFSQVTQSENNLIATLSSIDKGSMPLDWVLSNGNP